MTRRKSWCLACPCRRAETKNQSMGKGDQVKTPLERMRLIACVILLISFPIVFSHPDTSVRAPLLTLIGGAMVVMALCPLKEVSIEELLVLLGTGTIVGGAYYWVILNLRVNRRTPWLWGLPFSLCFFSWAGCTFSRCFSFTSGWLGRYREKTRQMTREIVASHSHNLGCFSAGR